MRFNNISRMIVILSFFFFNKVNIFSEINNYVKVKYENITLWDLTPQLVEKNKAENIIFGFIKVPGGKYIIKADKIKAELLKLGVKVVKIPDTITVERDFSEVKTAEVEAELLKVLQKDKTDFDYNVVINSRDTLKMPTGNIEYRVEENKVDIIYTCGPHVMMVAVARVAKEFGVRCQVSLEERMACGVKACMGCSIPTTKGMQKVCYDGPVFEAEEVIDIE